MKKSLNLLEKVTVCNSDMKDMKKPPHYLGTSLTLTLASKIEEYAEQQATEFASWVNQSYDTFGFHEELDEVLYQEKHIPGLNIPPVLTLKQLYQNFKEEQK